MSDPEKAGNDASDEWVELVNVSASPLNTGGWRISDAKGSDVLPAAEIPAGGYLVVAARSAETGAASLVVRVPDGVIGNGLSNSGDALTLFTPAGEIADAISYGSNTDVFEPPPPAPARGQSLGARDPAADPASENWDLTLTPSPGAPNTFVREQEPNNGATSAAQSLAGGDPAGDPRTLTPHTAHNAPGLSTLDWALIAGMLSCVSLVLGVAGRRYFETAWKRIHRGH
jgi:hypothetical protein